MTTKIPDWLYERLKAQTGLRCGYCRTSAKITGHRLTIEHIIQLVRGGPSDEDNLWLSCRNCNEYKGAQVDAIDPITNQRAPLFNPRKQIWREHFTWSADSETIIGLTPTGRATVMALKLNHPEIMEARKRWVSVGWHPPRD